MNLSSESACYIRQTGESVTSGPTLIFCCRCCRKERVGVGERMGGWCTKDQAEPCEVVISRIARVLGLDLGLVGVCSLGVARSLVTLPSPPAHTHHKQRERERELRLFVSPSLLLSLSLLSRLLSPTRARPPPWPHERVMPGYASLALTSMTSRFRWSRFSRLFNIGGIL